MLRRIIGKEAMRFRFLMESDKIDDTERSQYEALIGTDKTGTFTMSDDLLKDSLLMLSQFLQKHYGNGTVMLIDEYDVPLDKACRAALKQINDRNYAEKLTDDGMTTIRKYGIAYLFWCILFSSPKQIPNKG